MKVICWHFSARQIVRKSLFSRSERSERVTKVAEATASKPLKQRARARRTVKTKRSICFVTAKADLAGRCLRMAEGLQAEGYPVALYETSEFLRAPNPDFDVYVFHHPTLDFPQLRAVLTTLGKLRRILISDWDLPLFCDEIFGAEQSVERERGGSLKTTDYVAAMKLFTRLSAATAPLIELASLYQPDVELVTVPQSISPRQKDTTDVLNVATTPRNPKSLGFVCNTATAAADISVVYDLVFKILSEDPETTLTLFGEIDLPGPLLSHPQVFKDTALSPTDPHQDLAKVSCVVEPHADPVRDRCVSRLGFLQASLAGCQYIATPLPDLSSLKAPNLKLATSAEDWHDQILGAFQKAKNAKAARSAASYVKKNHSPNAALSSFQTMIA